MKTGRYLIVSLDLSFSLSDDPVHSQQLTEKMMEFSKRALMIYRNAKMNVGVANADTIQTLLKINKKNKCTACQIPTDITEKMAKVGKGCAVDQSLKYATKLLENWLYIVVLVNIY